MARVMLEYSKAVYLEGPCPLDFADLRVFIAPAPKAGASLLVRVTRDDASRRAASLAALERAVESDEGLAKLLAGSVGLPLGVDRNASPRRSERWAVAPEYAGIENAQLVVASARDEEELGRCEELIRDVFRLRGDDAVFHDIRHIGMHRTPVTAVAARLDDPKDPGLKKALLRVKRAVRNAQ